jgi:hypothetical protein
MSMPSTEMMSAMAALTMQHIGKKPATAAVPPSREAQSKYQAQIAAMLLSSGDPAIVDTKLVHRRMNKMRVTLKLKQWEKRKKPSEKFSDATEAEMKAMDCEVELQLLKYYRLYIQDAGYKSYRFGTLGEEVGKPWRQYLRATYAYNLIKKQLGII